MVSFSIVCSTVDWLAEPFISLVPFSTIAAATTTVTTTTAATKATTTFGIL